MFANCSNNPNALANKEAVLILLNKLTAELLATMHVSSNEPSSSTAAGAQAVPPPSGPASGVMHAAGVDASVYSPHDVIIAAMGDNRQLIQSLSSEALQCTQNFRDFGQEYLKFKESYMDYAETKTRMMEVDHQVSTTAAADKQLILEVDSQAVDLKQRQIEVDRQAKLNQIELDRQARLDKIELDRQASIIAEENRMRELKVEREIFEFSELKRKRALEEKEDYQNKEQQQGKREQNDNVNPSKTIITVRDVAEERPEFLAGISKSDCDAILMKAGGHCAKMYSEAKREILPKIRHGRFHVAAYNRKDEQYIIDALKWAVNEYKTAKMKPQQKTIAQIWGERNGHGASS
jgi:hypothetical protein